MNIPSFTAEASLVKMSGSYRTVGNLHQASGVIHPAQIPSPDLPIPRLPGDYPFCYYVCHEFCHPRLGVCYRMCYLRCQ
jgi:hypothetical protein